MKKHILTILALLTVIRAPVAAPTKGVVQNGEAIVLQQGHKTTIQQTSSQAILRWESFNIAPNEQVQFQQPSPQSSTLNRIDHHHGPSHIMGNLTANGHVYLINSAGIVFGKNAQIDVAGLVASTADMRDAHYLNGQLKFNPVSPKHGHIINQGTLTAKDHGLLALVAPQVINHGVLRANLGKVMLVTGLHHTVDLYGDDLILFADKENRSSSISHKTNRTQQNYVSNQDDVYLSTQSAKEIVDRSVYLDKNIQAQSATTKGDRIILQGDISAPGGEVQLLSSDIALNNTNISTSSPSGGGHISIGQSIKQPANVYAKTIAVDSKSTIKADAVNGGNGGDIAIVAKTKVTIAGTLSSQGGKHGGDGGQIETSAANLDYEGATVFTDSPLGTTGNWLIDPADMLISKQKAQAISRNLNRSNITLETAEGDGNGDIIFEPGAGVVWNSAKNLSVHAYRDISFQDHASINATGEGQLVLRADKDAQGVGTVHFSGLGLGGLANGAFISAHKINIHYNPDNFQTPMDYTPYVQIASPDQLFTGMLVHDVNGLQQIETNLSGHYVLAGNIDAQATQAWRNGKGFTPIGSKRNPFVGILDGQSHQIDHLYIQDPNLKTVGFIRYMDAPAVIQNIDLRTSDIHGKDIVGMLVGEMKNGIIQNCQIQGTVEGRKTVGGLVGQMKNGQIHKSYTNIEINANHNSGGLVGIMNHGLIEESQSYVTIHGENNVGGMVGLMQNQSRVTQADSQGWLYGNNQVGGLVGLIEDNASIEFSQSSARIQGNNGCGGLVGLTRDNARITQSYASGQINGQDNVGGFVGELRNASQINHCHTTAHTTARNKTGGFVGFMRNQSKIENSFTKGSVHGNNGVGGFVGNAQNQSQILDAQAYGDVTATQSNVGGFAGYLRHTSEIKRAFAKGNTSSTHNNVGGFVGYLRDNANIQDAYALGNVQGVRYIGGFAGNVPSGHIRHSFSLGASIGARDIGGVAGRVSNPTLEHVFWNAQTSGQNHAFGRGDTLGASGLTTNQMRQTTFFRNSGWDFQHTWGMIEGHSFPFHKSLYTTPPTVITGFVFADYQLSQPMVSESIDVDINQQKISASSYHNGFFYQLSTQKPHQSIVQISSELGLTMSVYKGGHIHDAYVVNSTFSLHSNQPTNFKLSNLKVWKQSFPTLPYTLSKTSIHMNAGVHFLSHPNLTLLLDKDISGALSNITLAGSTSSNRRQTLLNGRHLLLNDLKANALMLDFTGDIHPHGDISLQSLDILSGNWQQSVDESLHIDALPKLNVRNDFTIRNSVFKRFDGGDGTVNNPYQVVDTFGLQGIGSDVNLLDKNYIITKPLTAPTSSWHGNTGFKPIGTNVLPFTGRINGQHHAIQHIFIAQNNATQAGLIGVMNTPGQLNAVNLQGISVIGRSKVGGLIGILQDGRVTESQIHGKILGTDQVGALIGEMHLGTVSKSVASGHVRAFANNAGGLIGKLIGGFIDNSYSMAHVRAQSYAGGFIGQMLDGHVSRNYSISSVISLNSAGFIADVQDGHIADNFWNIETSGSLLAASNIELAGMQGLYSKPMMQRDTYSAANWNYEDIWWQNKGFSFPYHQWQYPVPPQVISGNIANVVNKTRVDIHQHGELKHADKLGTFHQGFFYHIYPKPTLHGKHFELFYTKYGIPTVGFAIAKLGAVDTLGGYFANLGAVDLDLSPRNLNRQLTFERLTQMNKPITPPLVYKHQKITTENLLANLQSHQQLSLLLDLNILNQSDDLQSFRHRHISTRLA